MSAAELPIFPWNDLIDMTTGDSSARVMVVIANAIHEAINANTLAIRAAAVSTGSEQA